MKILFKKQNAGLIGIELEGMLQDPVSGKELTIVSKSMIEKLLQHGLLVSLEASAAQLEIKTRPIASHMAARELNNLVDKLKSILHREYNCSWVLKPFASANLGLDFYLDEMRYRQIFANIDNDLRRFVMSAMALHIHIGCSDKKAALRLYSMLLQDLDFFIRRDYGLRLEKYLKMVSCALPPKYNSWDDFKSDAKKRNFYNDTSNNHSLIRITKHGTVELRTFNSSGDFESIDKLLRYIERYTVWA